MHPWEQPVEIRIAAAQAHLIQRVLEAREAARQRSHASDAVEAVAEPAH